MLNAAVIGLGNMGRHHARAYLSLPGVCLIAACDADKQCVDDVIGSKNVAYYPNVDDMLNNEALDLVSVCVPTSAHFSVAKACLEHGVSVLVEKPIAQTVDQANQLIACAATHDLVLTVGHIERFNPAILKAKGLIVSGKLGEVHTIQSKRYGPFPKQIKDADVLVDVAVHDIDIVQFLVAAPLSNTQVMTRHIHSKNRADYGHLILQFENGLTANIHVSWALPYKQRVVEIIGDKGIAIVDCMAQSIVYYNVDIKKSQDGIYLPSSEPEIIDIEKKEPIIEECRAFVEAVLNKTPPFICPKDATQALALALGAPH
jgi:UDP-N-acetylglucosamine 3-dehydrogenase